MSSVDTARRFDGKREIARFLILLLIGVLLVPCAVYFVGYALFGDYGGTGLGAFLGSVYDELRARDLAVWFLVLSPYLVWQIVRLTSYASRASTKSASTGT